MNPVPVSTAARYLGYSRQGVEKAITGNRLELADDASSRAVTRDSLIRVLKTQPARAAEALPRFEAALLALGERAGPPVADPDDVTQELSRERAGRALAEAKIVELEGQLARMRNAIAALIAPAADPDVAVK